MGAKDWMLLYAHGEVAPVLRSAPSLDREATRALIARLYPGHRIAELDNGNLAEDANPPAGHVYAACVPGLTVVCTDEITDPGRPSQLDERFIEEVGGRTLYLHAMHSVVDWFAYAIWTGDGALSRSLDVSPGAGVVENLGTPLPFEAPFWAGENPVDSDDDEDDDEPYPLPFHPLEMAEDALRHLFGFNYEGIYLPDDPDLDQFVLAGFTVDPNVDGAAWTLRMAHGPAWPEPDRTRIAAMLRRLAEDNFAVLERADGRFVQAVGHTAGGYAIEYQNGDLSRHCATQTSDLTDVIGVFQNFANGGQTWRRQHEWKPLQL
jgi:hypothetical protein